MPKRNKVFTHLNCFEDTIRELEAQGRVRWVPQKEIDSFGKSIKPYMDNLRQEMRQSQNETYAQIN